jgi:hypothetical protein
MPHRRGAGRLLLPPEEPARPARDLRLGADHRLRDRSGGEEAAQPLPSGDHLPLLRDARLQPRLPLLPELGHVQGSLRRGAHPAVESGAGRGAGDRGRRPRHRLHLQRSHHLGRVRHRRGAGGPSPRPEDDLRHQRLCRRRGARGPLRGDGRRQRGSQGLHRGVLPEADPRPPRAGAGDARVAREAGDDLGRGDQPHDPGAQRRPVGDAPARRVDGPSHGARRAAPLHRLPPGLEDDGPPPHAAGDADEGARDRPRRGAALRLHRQRPRRGRPDHVLPGLRGGRHRARLARGPEA